MTQSCSIAARWVRHCLSTFCAFSLVVLLLATTGGMFAMASSPEIMKEWNRLTSETVQLVNAGDMARAESKAREALEFSQKELENPSLELATAHNNLGSVLFFVQKYELSIAEHEAALAIRRQIMTKYDPLITSSLENLGDAYRRLARYGEAVPLFSESLQHHIERHGETSPQILSPLRNLAYALNFKQGRSAEETQEAFDLYSRVIAIRDDVDTPLDEGFLADLQNAGDFANELALHVQAKAYRQRNAEGSRSFYGPGHATTALALSDLAHTLGFLGEHDAAENAHEAAIESSTLAEGRLNATTAVYYYHLGDFLSARGNYEGAERAYRETLDIERQIFGEAHVETVNSYNTLGLLLHTSGKVRAAEPLLERARELSAEVHGTDSLWYATTTDNLALTLVSLGKFEEAIPLHRQALRIRERALGRRDPDTSRTLNNLALALQGLGELDEAEALFREALSIDRETLEPDDYAIAIALNNLAEILEQRWDVASLMEAAPMYAEALGIVRTNYPSSHHAIADSIHSFANVVLRVNRMAQGTPAELLATQLMTQAAHLYREAVDILASPVNRTALQDNAALFKTAAATFLHVSMDNTEEALLAAQWPLQSEASRAIAATSQRIAAGNDGLGQLVRRQQDMAEQHAQLNKRILDNLAGENAQTISDLRADLIRLESEISELSDTISSQFPDFAEYQGGEPISVDGIASVLADDEALVFINPGFVQVSGDEMEGSIFVVTPDGHVSSALLEYGDGIQRDAEQLSCSLQFGTQNCLKRRRAANTRGFLSFDEDLGASSRDAFDLDLAYNLYERIFAPVAAQLDKSPKLIVVSSDEALRSIPFQVLLTKPSVTKGGRSDYSAASWFIRKWAVSVATSVSAFHSGRSQAKQSRDDRRKPLLGFGDPVIGSAAEIDCEVDNEIQLASLSRRAVGVAADSVLSKLNGAVPFADVDAVRRFSRLPDTRCELERISNSLGGGDLYFDDEATETRIKDLNASGDLRGYKVISFATHGLVAGDTRLSEPALVLTPPARGSIEDDGLLTASEVASLDIDADWVLLSACNTAVGTIEGKTGEVRSESFSGLARAFFYAGAKSLLVSHWPVQSEAAVRLTTKTFEILREQPDIGRAAAFQLAMLHVIDDPKGTELTAHPNYWAPFTLLGDSR